MNDKWQEGSFLIGITEEPGTRVVNGFTYAGLGLREDLPDVWTLTHLNSGHAAGRSEGTLGEVLPGATRIAEAVDWTFKGIDGWKEQPQFMLRLACARCGGWDFCASNAPEGRSEKVAAQVAAARAS